MTNPYVNKLSAIKSDNNAPRIDFKYVFNNSSEGYLIQEIDTLKVVEVNAAALNILGLEREMVINKNPSLFLPKYQPNGQRSIDFVKQLVDEVKIRGYSSGDRIHYKPDGTACTVTVKARMVPESNDKLVMVSYKDNSTVKEQEDLIKAQYDHIKSKNEELSRYKRSNQELEQYAYVASHDLKSPIRSIVGFASILAEVLSVEDIESAKTYAGYINQASKDMHDTIMGLFNYSKANTAALRIDYFSPTQLIENVMLGQDHAIKQADAKVIIDGLPENISADRVQIFQLFQNLVSNALKFKKKELPVIIEITQEENNQDWVFCVKDNGIGINTAYKEKIFDIFSRLHSKEEYEGAGLGLALCKKIMEKHNGRIWVESKFGSGSAFYFSLPKHPKGI